MSDDIVTRLRRDVDAETYRAGVELKGMISIEAADEIERLRALLYCAESDRDYYHERFDQNQKYLDYIFKKKAWWKR